jgi:putative addiction module CopG family antidote
MDVKIGERWKGVIAEAVESGRYASEEEVINEAMTLVAEKERRFRELKASIEEAFEEGGSYTSEEVMQHVRETLAEAAARKQAAE